MVAAPYLSVVIPAYNEENNISHGVVDAVFSYLKKQNYTWEILFVDDGSTDNTRTLLAKEIAHIKNARLIENPHQGKAGTVISGVKEAKGTFVLFTDFDQATPLSEIERLLPHAKTYDVVIGSRAGQRKGAPLSRIIMARGYMLLRTSILGLHVQDTQCGFKLFSHKAAKDLFSKTQLYKKSNGEGGSRVTAGFDAELLYLANKKGYKIKEVPVEWRYVETRRVNPLRDSIDGLRDLFRIRIMSMRGLYD